MCLSVGFGQGIGVGSGPAVSQGFDDFSDNAMRGSGVTEKNVEPRYVLSSSKNAGRLYSSLCRGLLVLAIGAFLEKKFTIKWNAKI